MTPELAIVLAGSLAVLVWIIGRPLVAARRRRALAACSLTADERRALET
ncbi:MAG: hypothetical protein WD793_02715 [Steroidobacteraceae bacterium]